MKQIKVNKIKEIKDYDTNDTITMIDINNPLTLEKLGVTLPVLPPTQVISIRLPTNLINEIRALGSQDDIPYQALIKMLLARGVRSMKKSKILPAS